MNKSDFKDFIKRYVSVFGVITSWKELQILFNDIEKDKREQRKFAKLFKS